MGDRLLKKRTKSIYAQVELMNLAEGDVESFYRYRVTINDEVSVTAEGRYGVYKSALTTRASDVQVAIRSLLLTDHYLAKELQPRQLLACRSPPGLRRRSRRQGPADLLPCNKVPCRNHSVVSLSTVWRSDIPCHSCAKGMLRRTAHLIDVLISVVSTSSPCLAPWGCRSIAILSPPRIEFPCARALALAH